MGALQLWGAVPPSAKNSARTQCCGASLAPTAFTGTASTRGGVGSFAPFGGGEG